jgi:hypothetical protein
VIGDDSAVGDAQASDTHSAEMGAQANSLWDAGDVDGWLSLFRDDASFWIPGDGPLAGDHRKAAARVPVLRLMSAGGRYVIEQYRSPMGVATLFEQPVVRAKKRSAITAWTSTSIARTTWNASSLGFSVRTSTRSSPPPGLSS